MIARTLLFVGSAALAACGAIAASPDGVPQTDAGDASLDAGFAPSVPVTKLDLLFMIDNSASMGDKQELIRRAVPDLLTRLLDPRCVAADDPSVVVGQSHDGQCANGVLEFQPIHDMHIAVVTSSIGGRTSDQCTGMEPNPVNAALNRHTDDHAHLMNRAGDDEHVEPDASPFNFLAWFPQVAPSAGQPPPFPTVVDPMRLTSDFEDLVGGVHEYGCGFEAQLESWYRLLIQPDPYARIERANAEQHARLSGIDATILQQRHDFLRPDSAVAIIVVSDENDSTVDPLALGGEAWSYENSHFPGTPMGSAPRATAVCAVNPNDPACNSCGLATSDPSCQAMPYYTAAEDSLNERFFHMKQRFGVDPQFPIGRYVRGLTQTTVPSQGGEHVEGASDYTGDDHADCRNPLFAGTLPVDPTADLCNLPPGPRNPDHVFFLDIGGVPHQLLQIDPADPNSPQKPALFDEDWTRILGKDPLRYDFTGADPHMLESITPRAGLPPPTSPDDADPIHGREWDTRGEDLQYACVFELSTPKDCSNPLNTDACDCEFGARPPLCQSAGSTIQVRAKAYPTIRELALARALGPQGVVSSMCPIHVTEASPGDPVFGYRPAINALLDRLKNVLVR